MMLTEDEARRKWCPLARCVTVHADGETMAGNQPPRNRLVLKNSDDFKAQGSCIASKCMMWRWNTLPSEGSKGCCGLAATPWGIIVT